METEKSNAEMAPELLMKLAIMQAKRAYKAGDTPVGCIITYQGKIIARGYNKRNKTGCVLGHAEIEAIKKASKVLGDWRLEGCTMYVTLEPCPMCAGALVQSRIDRVVAGAANPKAGCAGSVADIFHVDGLNHQVDYECGVLEDECKNLLKDFFKELRQKKKDEKENIKD